MGRKARTYRPQKEKNIKKIVCDTKKKFLSETMAYEVIGLTQMGGALGVYKCENCGCWHLTTINQKVSVKRVKSKERRRKVLYKVKHLRE